MSHCCTNSSPLPLFNGFPKSKGLFPVPQTTRIGILHGQADRQSSLIVQGVTPTSERQLKGRGVWPSKSHNLNCIYCNCKCTVTYYAMRVRGPLAVIAAMAGWLAGLALDQCIQRQAGRGTPHIQSDTISGSGSYCYEMPSIGHSSLL